VPENAPRELHEAKKSLDTADSKDVGLYFPKTIERANQTFNQAVKHWKESQRKDSLIAEKVVVDLAVATRDTADGAYLIFQKMNEWDQNQTNFQDALAMIERDGQPIVEITNVEISPFAKLENSEVVSTLAYFATNDADEPIYNDKELDALAEILKKDQDFRVVLTGFADKRGSSDHNQDLALKRAQVVADDLVKRGIADSQVTYQSHGSSSAKADSGNYALLQLDRKVQAVLSF
jgi:outer membrane protein OmpA-like peptidoglycan-associated protein